MQGIQLNPSVWNDVHKRELIVCFSSPPQAPATLITFMAFDDPVLGI
jgi:hypothetical protein